MADTNAAEGAPDAENPSQKQGVHPGIAVWDARFASTEGFVFGTEPNQFMVSQAHVLKPGMKVLAVADGEGRNGVWLAQQGLDVTSVDGSQVALDKAARLARERGVTLNTVCADLVTWDWGTEVYDAVVGIFIQFAGPRLRPVLFQRAAQALKPGGYFLLQGYHPKQLEYKTGGPSAIENLYTEEQLRSELSHMEIIHLERYDAELQEGSGHHGMSALIDVVARKP